MKRIFLYLIASAMVAFPAAGQAQESVIFLVRHAEAEADGTRNPHLAVTGRERAELLAQVLRDAQVERAFSTDYHRTLETAGPLAQQANIQLELYDPSALAEFAERLKGLGQRVIVFGHSNTTPALVEALGGHPGAPIDHEEYDRLYVVTVRPDGSASTTLLLHYGAG